MQNEAEDAGGLTPCPAKILLRPLVRFLTGYTTRQFAAGRKKYIGLERIYAAYERFKQLYAYSIKKNWLFTQLK